jgi:glycine oxidase
VSRDLDLVVAGAGPWGLALAWRAAREGARVAVCDDGARPAGWVAAGMLGPWSEAGEDEEALQALMVRAAARWPGFADELAAASGRDPGYERSGALLVAARPDHVARVRRQRERLSRLGQEHAWVPGSRLRELEPGLSTAVAGGLHLPGEHQADPRRLLEALREACAAAGVVIRPAAARLLHDPGGRACGLATADGERIGSDRVALAAGWAAGRLAARVPLRPVKGQILRLATAAGAPPPVRHVIRAPSVYLVPRARGEVVVGATMEEAHDRRVTAGAVHELLDEAIHLVPDLRELAFAEAAAGLRPATPDGAPAIGEDPDDGLIWAVGGYRHGILLAPSVADALADLAAGRPMPAELAALSPSRFPAAREAACASR